MHLLKIAVAAFLLTAPSIALAQDKTRISGVGVIMTGTPKVHGRVMRELRQGLRALGYREGKSILLEPRYAMNNRARLPKLAKELVDLNVDVIVVTGARAARETRKMSATIPIVVATAGDLVGSGIVKSLAKPGGNTTGNTGFSGQLATKQLELLKEAIPSLKRVAVLYSKISTGGRLVTSLKRMRAAAPLLGLKVHDFGVDSQSQFEDTFSSMAKDRVGAVLLLVSRITSVHRKRLIELANTQKIPTMCWRPSMAHNGCFMSYGADRNVMYRHAATFVHKILQGAKPGELPIERPSKFGLSINLKTAKALGITVPNSVLLRADEVIP
jgi:putative ABC transport system substrate-binding protein